jgi:hypothetical protein
MLEPRLSRGKTTVKPGDVITGTGYQFSDGQKIIRLERVVCC